MQRAFEQFPWRRDSSADLATDFIMHCPTSHRMCFAADSSVARITTFQSDWILILLHTTTNHPSGERASHVSIRVAETHIYTHVAVRARPTPTHRPARIAPHVDGQQMLWPIVHLVARGIRHTAPVRATAKVCSSVPAAGRVARIARVVVDFDKRP